MLQSAVERQFGIIGEALNQAIKFHPELKSVITSSGQIVAFRNLLVHAYVSVDPGVVWGVVEEDLHMLLREAESLLASEGENT